MSASNFDNGPENQNVDSPSTTFQSTPNPPHPNLDAATIAASDQYHKNLLEQSSGVVSDTQKAQKALIEVPAHLGRLLKNVHYYRPSGDSGRLFLQMASLVGPNAITPPPEWLETDGERKHWLKSHSNALLYFLLKRDKYHKGVTRILNNCLLCNFLCPTDIKPRHYDSGTCGCVGRWVCCPFCIALPLVMTPLCSLLTCPTNCLFCCTPTSIQDAHWFSLSQEQRLSGKGYLDGYASNETYIKTLRDPMIKNLKEAGIEYDDCYPNLCCQLWCSCCYLQRYASVINYYRRKRYGATYGGGRYTKYGLHVRHLAQNGSKSTKSTKKGSNTVQNAPNDQNGIGLSDCAILYQQYHDALTIQNGDGVVPHGFPTQYGGKSLYLGVFTTREGMNYSADDGSMELFKEWKVTVRGDDGVVDVVKKITKEKKKKGKKGKRSKKGKDGDDDDDDDSDDEESEGEYDLTTIQPLDKLDDVVKMHNERWGVLRKIDIGELRGNMRVLGYGQGYQNMTQNITQNGQNGQNMTPNGHNVANMTQNGQTAIEMVPRTFME